MKIHKANSITFVFNGQHFNKEHIESKEDAIAIWNSAEEVALGLFHDSARSVPAYKDFLDRNGVDPTSIKTIEDFKQLPHVDKKNYIEKYPLHERCRGGSINGMNILATSSGTTGQSTIWPRSYDQEAQALFIHDLILEENFSLSQKSTLIIIAFPLGIYVSGMATLLPTWLLSIQDKYDAVVVPVGPDKPTIFDVISKLHGDFEQIIIFGHPFFVKNLIEDGIQDEGFLKLKEFNMVFSSEGFTEDWRQYVVSLLTSIGINSKAVSVYGSSELLISAFETDFSVAVRKQLNSRNDLAKLLIDGLTMPSLLQFDPRMRFIEDEEDELIITSEGGGMPLVRYNIHDRGRVLSYDDLRVKIKPQLFSKLAECTHRDLPCLALDGRSNMSIILYAANIYPEHVKLALETPELFPVITGKFTLHKEYDKNMNEYLEVHLELKDGVEGSKDLEDELQDNIIKTLKKVNKEYLFIYNNYDNDIIPRIKLWKYMSSPYFDSSSKHKSIR